MKKLLIMGLALAGALTMLAAPQFDAKTWSTVQKYDVRTLSRNFDSHVGELVEIQFNFRGKDIHHVKPGWYESSIWQPDPESRKHFVDVRVMVSKADLDVFKGITTDAASPTAITVYGKVLRESDRHWVFVRLFGRNASTDTSGHTTVTW